MSKCKLFTCLINGLIFTASVENKSLIKVSVYKLSHISREITDHDRNTLHMQLRPYSKGQIVHFGQCTEPDTGLSLPVIVALIKDRRSKKSKHGIDTPAAKSGITSFYFFAVLYNTDRKEILPLRYYNVEGQICRDISVLTDMFMIWFQDEILHTASPSGSSNTVLCKHSYRIYKHIRNITNIELIWADRMQGICETNYLIFTRITKQEEISNAELFLDNNVSLQLFLVLLMQKADGQWCKWILDASELIPVAYSTNLVTLSVIKCKLKHSPVTTTHMINKSGGNQTVIDSHVLALLEDGYFLELHSGQIHRCFQLDNPCFQKDFSFEIIGLFVSNLNEMAVLKLQTSEETECLAVDLQKKKIFQHWTNVSYILTGDFINLGKHQLLILFADWSFESCSGSWVLTDFVNLQIDTRKRSDSSDVCEDAEAASSVLAVVTALASRLQKSRISLQEDEKDLVMKKEFVLSTWNNLQKRSVGENISRIMDSMVPMVTIIEGSQTSSMDTNRKSQTVQTRRIQIHPQEISQHVVGDKLVAVVKFINRSERSVTDCVLSLVSKSSSSSKHSSRWPVRSFEMGANPTSVKSLYSEAKRLKLDFQSLPVFSSDKKTTVKPGRTATVACCTTTPSVSIEKDVSFTLILHFVESQDTEVAHSGKEEIISQDCGEIKFNIQDYLSGVYSIDFTKCIISDLSEETWTTVRSALDCAQLTVSLRLQSTFSLMSNIGPLLTQQAGFTFHEALQCYVCCECHALNLVRIQIQNVSSSREVIISVSARDENQILLVVQYLYSHLPDDITILSSNQSKKQEVAQNSLSTAADEIEFLTSGAQDLLTRDKDLFSDARSMSEESTSSINPAIDNFKQQQEKFEKQTKGFVSKEKFNKFLKQLQIFEQHTDKSFSHLENLN